VYAVLSVCCTQCILLLVYAALGVCWTWCMLRSVYTALSVNSWSWHRGIERDDLTIYSCDDCRVVDGKQREVGWRWERYRRYERIWEIMSTTYMIGFRRPHIGIITHQIGTWTCPIMDGQLTHTQNSPKSQFLMMISPISSDLSLSCAQLYDHLRPQS